MLSILTTQKTQKVIFASGHVLSLGWNQLQNFCLGWLSAVRKALTNFVQNVQYINENNYYYRSKKKNC